MKERIAAFTLIELLTVMAIIVILAGLVLGTSGYVQKKAARSRAESEIAAMSAAVENYKADNGIYPRDASTTDPLDAKTAVDPTKPPAKNAYEGASQRLYGQLSGDYDNSNPGASTNYNFKRDGNEKQGYMEFKPNVLSAVKDASGKITFVEYLLDPFGNSYGYSTAYQADLEKNPSNTSRPGYNPTYDLWSTGGQTTAAGSGQWIKNW